MENIEQKQINIGEVLCDRLLKFLETRFIEKHSSEQLKKWKEHKILDSLNENLTEYDIEFDLWLRQGQFDKYAFNLFNNYKLDNQQKYLFLKRRFFATYDNSLVLTNEKLFNKEIFAEFDMEWAINLLNRNRFEDLGSIISAKITTKKDFEFLEMIKLEPRYSFGNGYVARSILKHIALTTDNEKGNKTLEEALINLEKDTIKIR